MTNYQIPCQKKRRPNFLQVRVGKYNIIGVRILSLSKAEQYKQCLMLSKFVNNDRSLDKYTIIIGDFNCGELRGDPKATYDLVRDRYEYTRDGDKSPLRFYNFHKIREMFNNHVLNETMGESKSWGISLYQDAINYGGAKIKNDLVLFSNDLLIDSKYSWNFVRENEDIYRRILAENKSKLRNKIEHGFPDHAVLYVDILEEIEGKHI